MIRVLAEIVQNIPKTIMLYHRELHFMSILNKQHYSYTYTKVNMFDEINVFIKENTKIAFFDIFTSFHLEKPQNVHSQNLSKVRNIFLCLRLFCN